MSRYFAKPHTMFRLLFCTPLTCTVLAIEDDNLHGEYSTLLSDIDEGIPWADKPDAIKGMDLFLCHAQGQ